MDSFKIWHNALKLSLHEYGHCECTVLYNNGALYAIDLKACFELLEFIECETDYDESNNENKSKRGKISSGRIQQQLLCLLSLQFLKILYLKPTFPYLGSWGVFLLHVSYKENFLLCIYSLFFNADLFHSMNFPTQSSITHFCNPMPIISHTSHNGDVHRALKPDTGIINVAFRLHLL